METRLDEVWASVKNMTSNIAELFAFMKRGVGGPLLESPTDLAPGQNNRYP